VIGFGSMLDITNTQDKTTVTAFSLVASFNWRVAEIWNLGVRFPFSQASTNGPQPTPYKTYAAGNLELYARPSFQLTPRLRLPALLAVYMPTAQGDLFGNTTLNGHLPQAQALVNQAASFSRGWEEMPLFASRRIGLRAGAGITYDTESIHVAAGTHLDLMGKVSGEDDPGMSGASCKDCRLSSPTTAWVTQASFFYSFAVASGYLEGGLRAWLTLATLPVYSPGLDLSGPQFVLEPAVDARFPINADKSMFVKGLVGFIIPAAGPLGGAGTAGIGGAIHGVRIRAEFGF
jgi:hypothetical protein